MIECQVLGKIVERKNFQVPGVVSGFRFTVARAEKYDRDGMMPGVSFRIGISSKLPEASDFETGFFASFTRSGCFESLTVIDKSPGKGPAVGRVLSFNQDDPISRKIDNYIDRKERVAVDRNGCSAFRAHDYIVPAQGWEFPSSLEGS